MSERVVVFVDDMALVPEVPSSGSVLMICLDSEVASSLSGSGRAGVKTLSEYSERHFASYDELYEHFETEMRERFRPKDPVQQSRFLFETFLDDILAGSIRLHYIETLVREVFRRERPSRVELAIKDRELDAIVRGVVRQLS